MKRQLLTGILLQECPNCGAARLDRETTCRFCDTALVQVKRTTVIGVLSGVAKNPDQWVISDNGSSYSLKVTAQINGRETDVILRLPADTPVQECPVGSRIKIKGITDKENGKEYNDFVLV